MEAASYPLRIPKNMGAQDYVLSLYKKGRISLIRAAELLDVSTFDVLRLAQEKGIHIGATDVQQEKSRDAAAELTL